MKNASPCSAGVAEITKIRTERTHARTRIIWIANPPTGQTLAQHNQGVTAIRDLFKKPEDVRRLDFAITVASGDVDFAREINVVHDETGTLTYTSELCRTLALWAWSRRTDQVIFTPGAVQTILAAATEMGKRYHPAIPLVEPADQRLKLARLSVAAAARVHSTDVTGEKIVVTEDHAHFVARYLERVYNSPSMSYGEFSAQHKSQEVLDDSETMIVRSALDGWENRQDALLFFRSCGEFKKSELIDVVGWDDSYSKHQLKWLSSHRLVRPTRNGYRKNAVFIGVLRAMLNEPIMPVDLELQADDAF